MTSIDVGKANIKNLNVIKQWFGKTTAFTHRTTDPMANGTIIAFNGLGMLFAYPSFIGIYKNSIKGLPMITRNTVIGNVLLF